MVSNFERRSQGADDLNIRSQNFGGLNTTASPLNIPYEDSPNLLNVDVDVSGNVSKRQGTEILLKYANTTPVYTFPVKSVLGYDYVLTKSGGLLEVAGVIGKAVGAYKSFSNVFSAAAANVKPYFTLLSDVEPRVLILTGTNTPVQVKFVEQTFTTTSGSPTTTVVIPNASRFQYDTPILYMNRNFTSGATYSYNSTTRALTISNLPSWSGTMTFDLVLPVWSWWAESLRWFGDRFYDAVSRFNVNKADQSVSIPAALRSDLDTIQGTYGRYPMLLYKTATFNDTYTFSNTGQPTNADAYGWGDGSVYNVGASAYLNTSPFFATFGDTRTPTPQPPETVHLLRQRELRFNYGNGATGANLRVTVDGASLSANYSSTVAGTNRAYALYKADGTLCTSASDLAYYIAFTGATPLGISPTAAVTITNVDRTYIGSAATQTDNAYVQGGYFKVYGLGLWANYGTGQFPRIATVYQSRLVLGGFTNDPTRVVFSATGDTVEGGVKYNFFQVTDDLDGLDSDPFDLVVSSSQADDYVTGLVEWQSSLFVLTRRATFRANGGDATISPARRFVNYISSLGLVNPFSVVRTDTAVFYLSDSGVFNLTPRVEDGEYQAIEKSIKIRKVFGKTTSTAVSSAAWMSFDQNRKVLYVALPRGSETTVASALYVYNTFRDSWTQYDTLGGFKTYTGHPYVDTVLGDSFLLMVAYGGTVCMLKLYGSRYVDFFNKCGSFTGTVLTANSGIYTWTAPFWNSPVISNISVSGTTTLAVQRYELPTDLQVVPYDNVEDLSIYINGTRLSFGTDWVKQGKAIYLLSDPGDGKTVSIVPRCPVNVSYQGDVTFDETTVQTVWVNNLLQIQGTDYTLSGSTLTFTDTLTNAVVEVGNAYISYYQSPMFLLGSLSNLKKVKHVYLYFDNEDVLPVYTIGDLASGQDVDDLVGKWKTRANANISVTYDSENTSETSYDIYSFSDLVWDNAFFDVDPTNLQSTRYALFKEALLGVGYNYQIGVWSFDEASWKLCGYQVDARLSGKRYTGGN